MSDNKIIPRTNDKLLGHDEAEAALLQGLESGKLAHGWIISGPRGIGKATLAYRFARTLLSSPSPLRGSTRMSVEGGVGVSRLLGANGEITPLLTSPPQGGRDEAIFRRIAAGSHTDLLVIEQIYDEKKEGKTREISVEQVRAIAQFLSLTPGEGQWRVVIIDSADALNSNSANAILKILEEPPPQTVLMLIAHNPNRLLPTIRSRCRSLKLRPLSKNQFTSVMRHIAPTLEGSEIRALAQLSAMAPGVALELHEQEAAEKYEALLAIVSRLPTLDASAVHAFAEKTAGGKTHTNWHVFTQLVLFLFSRVALLAEGIEVEAISDNEAAALKNLAALHPASVWAAKWQQVADEFMVTERLHLDYKQVIIAFFHSINAAEGFRIGSAA